MIEAARPAGGPFQLLHSLCAWTTSRAAAFGSRRPCAWLVTIPDVPELSPGTHESRNYVEVQMVTVWRHRIPAGRNRGAEPREEVGRQSSSSYRHSAIGQDTTGSAGNGRAGDIPRAPKPRSAKEAVWGAQPRHRWRTEIAKMQNNSSKLNGAHGHGPLTFDLAGRGYSFSECETLAGRAPGHPQRFQRGYRQSPLATKAKNRMPTYGRHSQ